jgi:hypothetical protein
VRGLGINYMKRKKASSNYDINQCKKCTIARMAFKGTIKVFAGKEYWYKNFKGKKVPCEHSPGFFYKNHARIGFISQAKMQIQAKSQKTTINNQAENETGYH